MRYFWFILVLVAAGLLCGCMSGGGEQESSKTTLKDLEPVVEARQFFGDPKCVVWNEGFPISELKQLCEDLYRAGSPKVMFGGADEHDGRRMSALFVAEVPKDKAARDRVIKVWNDKLKDSDYEVEPGEDVDFLELALD